MNTAMRFAPLNHQAARYKDANDEANDGLDQDVDGAAREMAEFIKKSFREAQGEEPADADKSDEAAKALARARSYEERVAASAALIRSFVR
jgi:hypothetical protein